MNIKSLLLYLLFLSQIINAQNVGIGTSNPVAPLNLFHPNNNKLLFHNAFTGTTINDGLYLGNNNNMGGYLWNLENSILSFGTSNTERMMINHIGNIGIGTNVPSSKLTIADITSPSIALQNNLTGYSASDGFKIYADGRDVKLHNQEQGDLIIGANGQEQITLKYNSDNVGINNSNPLNALGIYSPFFTLAQFNNSTTGLGSTDGLVCGYSEYNAYLLNYENTNLIMGTNGLTRLTIANNGNVHINNTLSVNGAATVNNGKGVAYSTDGATNLKIHRFTTGEAFAVLAGFEMSPEFYIGFGGGFTSPPTVTVGDIEVTSGTAGQLYRVQLQLYDCTTTTCKARLINTSPNAVNYMIRWNCVAIGY